MPVIYTPATCAPVEVTSTARAAGLPPGFRMVMAANAHDRAGALSDHYDLNEGVSTVVEALNATLEALIENNRTLSAGITWTIHTSNLWRARWTVLVAADKTNPRQVILYITPAA